MLSCLRSCLFCPYYVPPSVLASVSSHWSHWPMCFTCMCITHSWPWAPQSSLSPSFCHSSVQSRHLGIWWVNERTLEITKWYRSQYILDPSDPPVAPVSYTWLNMLIHNPDIFDHQQKFLCAFSHWDWSIWIPVSHFQEFKCIQK